MLRLIKLLVPIHCVHRRCAVVTLVILAMISGCSEERAKWTAAKASVCAENGEVSQAISLFEEAIAQDPGNHDFRLKLALQLAINGQGELGINHCNIYIDKHPEDLNAYRIRSECYQYLGRFEEALADYKLSIGDHVQRSANENNALAYFRALANVQLGLASSNIDETVKEVEEMYWGASREIPLVVRGVVAAGLLSRRVDAREEVLPRLNQKIESCELELRSQQTLLNESINRLISAADSVFPLSETSEENLLPLRSQIDSQTKSLVVLLATRALVLEDLGQLESCDQDRNRIEELGSDFEKASIELPEDFECLSTLEYASAFLDTRGFILSRLPWKNPDSGEIEIPDSFDSKANLPVVISDYLKAMDDLNTAVLAAQIHRKALESSLYNSAEIPVARIKQMKLASKHTVAVLLNHRMELYRRFGSDELAEADQEQIIELGFKAGACLF